MKKEIWKEIKGYPNYMVSNCGRVKSLNYKRTGKEKILKPSKNKKGYLIVGLCKNGKRKVFLVHRLVAMAFIPNPNNYQQVNHKDENPQNNFVSNLEYCDVLYNNNYGTRNKRMADTKKGVPNIKLSKEVTQIDKYTNEIIKVFPSIMEVSRKLGYSQGNIACCCRGERKQAYGYIWRYKESVA